MSSHAREALKARGVGFEYPSGKKALDEITLSLARERVTSITGPNGSGKSTLLKVLAGLLVPGAGKVSFNGRAMNEISRLDAARKIAFLPQEVVPAFNFTAWGVVMTGRYPHLGAFGVETEKDAAVVGRVMEETSCLGLANRSFDTLSGGEKKRVLVASVLAQEPEILLLDEPTAALDIRYQFEIYELLRRQAEGGIAVCAVTHDLNLAARFADETALLSSGRVEAYGKPKDVFTVERLERVYGTKVALGTHPETGDITVFPGGSAEGGSR